MSTNLPISAIHRTVWQHGSVAYNTDMLHDFRLRFVRFGLRLSLLLLALSGALVAIVGSPDTVKQAVADSRIYDAAANILSDQPTAKEVPAVRPVLKEAVNSSLPPAEIQAAAEQFVDGTYNWLEGETAKPDFKIDLSPVVDRFTTVIGDATAQQAQALPACSLEQTQQLAEQKLAGADLLSFGCLPAGMTPAMIREQAISRLASSNRLIEDPILTADTLPTNAQGQTFFQTASSAPGMYHFITILPWILGGLAVILAGLVVWMSRTIASGLYDVAVSLFWTGVLIVVLGGVSHVLFAVLTQPGGSITQSTAGSFQQYIIAFGRSLEAVWFKHVLFFGGGYSLVGGLTVVGLRLRSSAGQPGHEHAAMSEVAPLTDAPGWAANNTDEPTADQPIQYADSAPKPPKIESIPSPTPVAPGTTVKPKDT